MRKTILCGAALLVCAAPAAAHNAGMTIDCDTAQVQYSLFPSWRDSYITHTITAGQTTIATGTTTVRRSGVIDITFDQPITGLTDVVFNIAWDSDTDGERTITTTLDCPVPVAPEPPPVVTTPVVPIPPDPIVPPTPTVPVTPKPRLTCQDLILRRAGENTLRKAGCKVTPLKRCKATQQRTVKAGRVVCIPKRRIVPVTG